MVKMVDILSLCKKAKQATEQISLSDSDTKNRVLANIAKGIQNQQDQILTANQIDVEEAKASGMSDAMLDRLVLDGRLKGIAQDIERVIELEDPVGQKFDKKSLPNGLELSKVRTPIGVIGVIYEARPNVTIDVATLAIKTGNVVVLRGGSETIRSNSILVQIVQEALQNENLPAECVQLIESPDRALVMELLQMHEYIEMIIPRGGATLHQFCRENSQIPVITGGIGICHLYVEPDANLEHVVEVVRNAKVQRPTVCNALDTLLVHEKIAETLIPKIVKRLEPDGVTFKLDQKASQYAIGEVAGSGDWDKEWLSLVLGIRVVTGIEEAVAHIRKHSTGHSDGILTENRELAEKFVRQVDSSTVYVNASTRFTDGSQFGLGAEVAISTQKLHARGPMGLQELTTYKWVVIGNYQVRE